VRLQPRRSAASGPGADRDALLRATAAAVVFFRATLGRPEGVAARNLIKSRGFKKATVETWSLGAAPDAWDGLLRHTSAKGLAPETMAAADLLKRRDSGPGHYDTFRNRLVFPIHDELGRVIAFGGRQLGEQDKGPKYLNSAESPIFKKARTLYGLHQARSAVIKGRRVVVTEGYTDVVACHQAGFNETVATLGTALTAEHVEVLKRLCEEVVLVFDGDEAGQRAADRALEIVFAQPLDVRICVLPGGLDPADLLAAADGPDRLRTLLEDATDVLEFKVQRYRSQLQAAEGLAGRRRVLDQLVADLVRLGFDRMAGVHRGQVEGRLEQLLGIRAADLEQALRAAIRTRGQAQTPATESPDVRVPAEHAPPARARAERELLAVLIGHPTLAQQRVAGSDGKPVPAARRFEPDVLRDPAAGALARIVLPWLTEGREFSVQLLMGELEDPSLRRLAADLYLEGERAVETAEGSPAELLQEVCRSLEGLLERDRYREDLDAYRQGGPGRPSDVEALTKMLERRRQQGYIPEAMPSGVRPDV
jgi:DNA primase